MSYRNYRFAKQNRWRNYYPTSGTALERNNLSWNLMQSYNSHDDEVGGNMSLTYDGSYGTVNGSYNYSQNSQRLNYGIRGGILAHSEGVTLSQELGETIALVKAPGAAGLEIDNMRGAATDWRGYTVKTQLNPYDENRVAISDNYFSKSNIELDNTVVTMVPTRGAVVKAEFGDQYRGSREDRIGKSSGGIGKRYSHSIRLR